MWGRGRIKKTQLGNDPKEIAQKGSIPNVIDAIQHLGLEKLGRKQSGETGGVGWLVIKRLKPDLGHFRSLVENNYLSQILSCSLFFVVDISNRKPEAIHDFEKKKT